MRIYTGAIGGQNAAGKWTGNHLVRYGEKTGAQMKMNKYAKTVTFSHVFYEHQNACRKGEMSTEKAVEKFCSHILNK